MNQTIIERAWHAYLASDGFAADRPGSLSDIETLDDLTYAVLRSERGITIAVYRITGRGRLRRMKRWPLALNMGCDVAPRATKTNPREDNHGNRQRA